MLTGLRRISKKNSEKLFTILALIDHGAQRLLDVFQRMARVHNKRRVEIRRLGCHCVFECAEFAYGVEGLGGKFCCPGKLLVNFKKKSRTEKKIKPLCIFLQNRCAACFVVVVLCEIGGQSLLQRFLLVVWFLGHLLHEISLKLFI